MVEEAVVAGMPGAAAEEGEVGSVVVEAVVADLEALSSVIILPTLPSCELLLELPLGSALLLCCLLN